MAADGDGRERFRELCPLSAADVRHGGPVHGPGEHLPLQVLRLRGLRQGTQVGHPLALSNFGRFRDQQFYLSGGRFFCKQDYFTEQMVQQKETLCAACKLPIQETVLSTLSRHFHPRCFRCTDCYSELDGVPFSADKENQVSDPSHSPHVHVSRSVSRATIIGMLLDVPRASVPSHLIPRRARLPESSLPIKVIIWNATSAR